MAFNPRMIGLMKDRLDLFTQSHPKFVAFLQNIGSQGLQEGTIVELKVISPDGKEKITNIRLNRDDIETIEMAARMRG